MDLVLFIMMIVFSTMIYYLIGSIQSLLKEIREIKNKCIHTNNSEKDDFKVDTQDPSELIKEKAINILTNLKKIVDE